MADDNSAIPWWSQYREIIINYDDTCEPFSNENARTMTVKTSEIVGFTDESTSATFASQQYNENSSSEINNHSDLEYSFSNCLNSATITDYNFQDYGISHSAPVGTETTQISQSISIVDDDEQNSNYSFTKSLNSATIRDHNLPDCGTSHAAPIDSEITAASEISYIEVDDDQNDCSLQEPPLSQKVLSRKRKKNPDDWDVNILKKAANYGQDSNNSSRLISKRELGVGCISCRYKCSEKISMEQRLSIFSEFWNLGKHTRQWDYLDKSITVIPHKINPDNDKKSRKIARQYFLSEPGRKIRVCRTMFVDTFGISRKWLETIENKKKESSSGQTIDTDNRGKHFNKPKKIKPETTNSVRRHIESFEKMDSHFCRASTSREYISSHLSINKMYRLYNEEMMKVGQVEIASEHHYREIFCTNYNLSFHQPKKDQCDECTMFYNLTSSEKLIAKEKQDKHEKNKDYARSCMQNDKEAANIDKSICCASFDLQKVLNVPCGESSSFYYKRKLSIYNFTIFDMVTKEGQCFIWNETISKRGANEISSCLWKFLNKKIGEGYKDFRFYSDNCGGQNRNSILYSMYMKATMNSDVTITHSYLVKGHTQMDGDCMHSTIEHAARNQNVYTQNQWYNLIRSAKVNPPLYEVHNLEQPDILNFSECVMKQQWKNIPISKLSLIKISNGNLSYIKEYSGIVVQANNNYKDVDLEPCYEEKLPLDENKKKDLKALMKNKLIPTEFHDFYNQLME